MKNKVYIFILLTLSLMSCQTKAEQTKLSSKAKDVLTYCKVHKMNTNYCFLIDMSTHSGKNRFFVCNFQKQKVEFEGLVCHGAGSGSTGAKPVFRNVVK
jgi:hypothetical protein